jgi:hypothetical protein
MAGSGASVLDIGARDGYVSVRLAQCFQSVTALDLEQPRFTSARVTTVAGDATALQFADRAFDCVVCAEVLEHIAPNKLRFACRELVRVTRQRLLIGVPYRQDRRVGKTRCAACGKVNPPWGHVNSFDESRLRELFAGLKWASSEFVGADAPRTNAVSSMLMTLAGNPYGTYVQEEPCVHCGAPLRAPEHIGLLPRVTARVAISIEALLRPLTQMQPNWLHVLFERA